MLLFLDIDGVMVPAKTWEAPEMLNDGFFKFSDEATYALNQLLDRDTNVILTSSHRGRFSVQDWKSIFKRRGININKLQLVNEVHDRTNRKDLIINWLNSNKWTGDYLILDDDKSLHGLPPKMKDKLIITSSMVGLKKDLLPEVA